MLPIEFNNNNIFYLYIFLYFLLFSKDNNASTSELMLVFVHSYKDISYSEGRKPKAWQAAHNLSVTLKENRSYQYIRGGYQLTGETVPNHSNSRMVTELACFHGITCPGGGSQTLKTEPHLKRMISSKCQHIRIFLLHLLPQHLSPGRLEQATSTARDLFSPYNNRFSRRQYNHWFQSTVPYLPYKGHINFYCSPFLSLLMKGGKLIDNSHLPLIPELLVRSDIDSFHYNLPLNHPISFLPYLILYSTNGTRDSIFSRDNTHFMCQFRLDYLRTLLSYRTKNSIPLRLRFQFEVTTIIC